MSKLSTKTKIILGAVLVIILLFIATWVWVVPASVKTVCEHAVKVVSDEFEDQFGQKIDNDTKKDLQTRCEKDEEKYAEDKGIFEVKERRDCILKADNMQKLEDCDK